MKIFFPLVFVALLLPLDSFCWNRKGHEIIVEVANHFLTPKARLELTKILNGMPLANAGNWLDEPQNRYTLRWHFIGFPKDNDEEILDEANLVTMVNKTVFKLRKWRQMDTSTLKFNILVLLHLMGDLHQPVHISNSLDKGANMVRVEIDSRHTNLHAVWDSYLITNGGLTTEKCLAQYSAKDPQWQVNGLAVLRWAGESRKIFIDNIYGYANNSSLDDIYIKKSEAIANRQLLLSGLRLAYILNHFFN